MLIESVYSHSLVLFHKFKNWEVFFFLSFASNKHTIQEFRAKMAWSELLTCSFTYQKDKENKAKEGYKMDV